MGLVDDLQDRGQQPLGGAEDLRGPLDLRGRHVTDTGRPPGGALLDHGRELLEADGVRVDVGPVDAAGADDLGQQRVEEGDVRAGSRGEVDVGAPGDRRVPRVHAHEAGRVAPLQAVQEPHPQDGLRLRHVVPEQGDGVGVVDVLVGAGLPVAAEGLLERLGGGRRTQPGVAVQVVGADAGAGEDGQGVVLLQEQLPGGVEADRALAFAVQEVPGPGGDPVHGGVPVGLHQSAVLTDQGPGEPVRRGVGLPAVEVLGTQASTVHPVLGPAPHSHDAALAHRDVHRVAVGVQQRGGLHPPLHVLLGDPGPQVRVRPGRPGRAGA